MPIYEYQCAKCKKTIEVIQKFSDKPLKKHAGCGGTLTKLISASGFQFKGTGWYVTDYARKSSSENKESSSENKESSKDAKTESKEASSNGHKEASTDKPSPKADKKDSPAKSGSSKD
jgi:putative FmdB family regulatory protein